MLLDSIIETPDQNYWHQGINGMYLHRMEYTRASVNKVDDLCKASCEPSSFNYVPLHDRDGTLVKKGKIYLSNKKKIIVILRTRSGHGVTLEFNLSFPEPDKFGEIRKILILSKLIVI